MLQRDVIAFTIALTDIKDENGHTLIHIEGRNSHRSSLFVALDDREDGAVQNLAEQNRQETTDRPAKKPPENPRYR